MEPVRKSFGGGLRIKFAAGMCLENILVCRKGLDSSVYYDSLKILPYSVFLKCYSGLLNWSGNVTKLGEGKFCFLDKIPFAFEGGGFQCGICPVKTCSDHMIILYHVAKDHAGNNVQLRNAGFI